MTTDETNTAMIGIQVTRMLREARDDQWTDNHIAAVAGAFQSRVEAELVSPLLAERDRALALLAEIGYGEDGHHSWRCDEATVEHMAELVEARDEARQVARTANNNCADFAEALGLDRDCYGDEIIAAAHLLLWLHAEAQWHAQERTGEADYWRMTQEDTSEIMRGLARRSVAARAHVASLEAQLAGAVVLPEDWEQWIWDVLTTGETVISCAADGLQVEMDGAVAAVKDLLRSWRVATQPAGPPGKVTTLHVTVTREVSDGHTDQRVRYEWEGDSWEGWLISYGIVDGVAEAYVMRDDDGKAWVVLRENVTEIDAPEYPDVSGGGVPYPQYFYQDEPNRVLISPAPAAQPAPVCTCLCVDPGRGWPDPLPAEYEPFEDCPTHGIGAPHTAFPATQPEPQEG